LAVALAGEGYSVGLLDADIFGPSVPRMFGIENEQLYMHEVDGRQLIIPIERYGVKLLSIGLVIDPDKAALWRGSMASNALKQLIEQADWGELDYFLIDMPPGTSDIHLTLVQTLGITGALSSHYSAGSRPGRRTQRHRHVPRTQDQRSRPRHSRQHGLVHPRKTPRASATTSSATTPTSTAWQPNMAYRYWRAFRWWLP